MPNSTNRYSRLDRFFFALVLGIGASAAFAADDQVQKPTNRLARETSPYLRQHAHNPVDWYPWGPEALTRAIKEDRMIFLSIGYSACHWCHVMERESFNNPEVAKLLNSNFVCIKVDREERPDIDQIYMTSLQFFGIQGGWPLTMFLTPDAKPIAGGTYWPVEDRVVGGQRALGLKSIIRMILDLRQDEPKQVREQSDEVARIVARTLNRSSKPNGPAPRRYIITSAVDSMKEGFDPEYGGFGSAARSFRGTKFPMAPAVGFLLQQAVRQNSDELLKMATLTLDRMAMGGIYDQIGGGFHRYSTERTWTVPHFEKMLYDNAQLVEIYAKAYEHTKNPLYGRIVRETLEFVSREMTDAKGGFYSSLDADSEGVEGRYYVWTSSELDAVIPGTGAERAMLGLSDRPNFEGKYFIPTRARKTQKLSDDQLNPIRQNLLAARSRRPRPFLDTKIITAWNGQMIAAYAIAGRVLNQPQYIDAAAKASDFVLQNLRSNDGRLLRSYCTTPGDQPKACLTAYLDDYAFLVHGLLCLHDATSAPRWLAEAKDLTDLMIRHYGDEGGFYYTADDHERLFARAKDLQDGVQPSGNSMAALNLVRLAAKTGDIRYREMAERTFRTYTTEIEKNPTAFTFMLTAIDQFLEAEPQPPANTPQAKSPSSDKPDGAKRSDAVVKAKATAAKPSADGKQSVTITLVIDKGWHIYANPVGNESQEESQTTVTVTSKTKPKNVKIEYPKSKVVNDVLVGNYNVYEGTIEIKAAVERAAGDSSPLEIRVKLQACDDKSCLLPATIKLTVP